MALSSWGYPGETKETIQQTLDFAKEMNPHTIQVSLAAPYPGTFLYRQAKENGWLYNEEIDLLTQEGTQIAPLNYPHLSHTEIFASVEDFYKKFYFRPSKIASIVAEMIASPEMMKRRLREGVEFFRLRTRHDVPARRGLIRPDRVSAAGPPFLVNLAALHPLPG